MPAPPVRTIQPDATVQAPPPFARPMQPDATVPALPPIAQPARLEATVPAPPPIAAPAPAPPSPPSPPAPPAPASPAPVPPAPAPPAPVLPAPVPRTGGRAQWLLALIVGLACVAYAVAWISFGRREEPDPGSADSSAATLTPPALPAPSASGPSASVRSSQTAEPPAPMPCCGKNGKCSSGRECDPTQQGCKTSLPARSWSLRLLGAEFLKDPEVQDLSRTHGKAAVCLQSAEATEPEVCAPMTEIARTGGDRGHRLRVLTEEIKEGAINVRIIDEHREALFEGKTDPIDWPLKTALCGGLRLKVTAPDGTLARLSFYLDDN